MTITKYTFFSPNGDDFPVTANGDGKLYMLLTGMNYDNYRIKFWEEPINTALNRVYVNTSLVVGGRYFELHNHLVTLMPNTTNFVHAAIDLSNTSDPVTITVEASDNSNVTDINNSSGILKRCFDIVTTSGAAVISSRRATGQTIEIAELKTDKLTITTDVKQWTEIPLSNVATARLRYKLINGIVYMNGQGNWGSFTAGQSKTICTLPANLRPDLTCNYVITTQNGSGQPMEIQFQEGGNVNLWSSVASGGRYGGMSETYTTANS